MESSLLSRLSPPPEEQEYWLNYAEEHKLTTRELRAAIKGAKADPLPYSLFFLFGNLEPQVGRVTSIAIASNTCNPPAGQLLR